jgi:GrpB-like predicted nucleotidyltransferase (UPF0157 family)
MGKRAPHQKILEYDDEYPVLYRDVANYLKNIIPYEHNMEHVGSTAIPGCGGRRVIDILISTDKENMHKIVDTLVSRGFKHSPEGDNPPEKLFVSGYYRYGDEDIHIHIHITYHGSKEEYTKILFRDYLRNHPDEAENYYRLKMKWVEEAKNTGEDYGDLKTPYIKKILKYAEEKTT